MTIGLQYFGICEQSLNLKLRYPYTHTASGSPSRRTGPTPLGAVRVSGYPRFFTRGVLRDFNTLHWHQITTLSFPVESFSAWPEITAMISQG